MRAIVHQEAGAADVLTLVERPLRDPGPGEVRVRVIVSGVNPTDWKSRSGGFGAKPPGEAVPNQDGAGIIDALGDDVTGIQIGDRVWVTLAAYQNPLGGTAQEFAVVPAERVFLLPTEASFELGASVGIPAITAHRALTTSEDGPSELAPGALSDKVILVAGGAGAVGNAAIQLAKWAGAQVITTVSGPEKAQLARKAGADHILTYSSQDVAAEVRTVAPDGVDLVVEVAIGANASLDLAVLKPRGTIAVYANNGDVTFSPPIGPSMGLNVRYQFVLLYTLGWERMRTAGADVNAAIADGALGVGEAHGLPIHRFRLDQAADAHRSVEAGATGKALIAI